MATFAYQITGFAYQGVDAFSYQGVEHITGSGILLAASGAIAGTGTVTGGSGPTLTRRMYLDMDGDGIVSKQ